MGCAFCSERQLWLPTCKTTCLLSLLDFSSLKAGVWGEPESPAGIAGRNQRAFEACGSVCTWGASPVPLSLPMAGPLTLTCLCP